MKLNIEDYEPAPRHDPTIYPGTRPPASFLFNGTSIYPIDLSDKKLADSNILIPSKGTITIQAHFRDLGDCNFEDHFMIVGYGSNINPAQLAMKFHNSKVPIAVIKGQISGYDIVYASQITPYGAIPATIEESPQTRVEAWVNILSLDQLRTMDKSEGRGHNYWLVEINDSIILENGMRFSPIYAYIAATGVLAINGNPARLAEVTAKRAKFSSKTQLRVLQYVLGQFESNKSTSIETFLRKVRMNRPYRSKIDDFLTRHLSLKPKLRFKIIEEKTPPNNISEMSVH